MNKGKQVLAEFWELFQKKMLLESHIQKEQLKDYIPSEIHCVQYVGSNPNSNVTKLATAFRMTTGGVTKLTKKLVEKGLLKTYKSPDNRKEIYFCLTAQGQKIYKIHEQLNHEFDERDRIVFEQITEEEYDQLLHFVELYSQHLEKELQKLDIDVMSGNADRL